MINFNQKTVWISGASSGIGKALAVKFASLGANLVISSRNEELLKELANSCNSNTFILPLDLEKSSEFPEKVEQVLSKFKTIDLLINNGGTSQRLEAFKTAIELDRKIMEINYFGTIALTKAVLPIMQQQKKGHILLYICMES